MSWTKKLLCALGFHSVGWWIVDSENMCTQHGVCQYCSRIITWAPTSEDMTFSEAVADAVARSSNECPRCRASDFEIRIDEFPGLLVWKICTQCGATWGNIQYDRKYNT